MILRLFITLVVLALLLVAAIAAFAEYQKRTAMFFPTRYPEGTWSTSSLGYQPRDVAFTASDGVHLHGWYFESPSPAPLMIWFHGNAGNLSERAPVASAIAAHGMSVLLFDYRGFGRSEARHPSEEGVKLDSLAAYDFAVRELGTKRCIVLYGESIGGPFAAFVATRRKASALVMENSFSSLSRIGDTMYPVPLGIFVHGSLDTVRWVNESRLPTLVIHGRKDQVIPFKLGKELYDGITGEKEMLISDNAAHSEIPLVEGERYYETLLRFANAHCGPVEGSGMEPQR